MRRPTLCVFALALLGGCYSPNYGSKPCMDNDGCPADYFCDTTRAATGAAGTCTMGTRTDGGGGTTADLGSTDLAYVTPITLTEYKIPAGTFILGSDLMDVPNSGDAPAYSRTMPALCVAEKEVTVADYKKCVDAGKCNKPVGVDTRCNYGVSGKENHPVNCVELPQAVGFCDWIDRRLPTESEWEYAANGTTSSTGAKFPWTGAGTGTFDPAKACFNNNGTCPVGSKVRTYQGGEVTAANPGFYDFAGNVWEWTTSELCPYVMSSAEQMCGSPARVVRGGSGFDTNNKLLRSTVRLGNAKDAASMSVTYPNSWFYNLGFRCFGDVSGTGACIK